VKILLGFLFVFATFNSLSASINVRGLSHLHDHEVAARAIISNTDDLTVDQFKSCSPQESIPFPNELTADLREQIFIPREMRDLRSCRPDSCAFNFHTDERKKIAAGSSNEDVQNLFFQFFQNRVAGKKGISDKKRRFFITDAEKAFSICHSDSLNSLLADRPLKDWPYRLSNVRYESQMRPTTRLTQGKHLKINSEHCFLEGLIFSDHYDVELIKLWSFKPEEKNLTIEIRYRLDFLHTWFRRLQKPRIQSALERVLREEVDSFYSCVRGL